MCGINGFTWKDEALIQKMNTKITHRGPDGEGVFLSPEISLGHRRLSIIDLSDAARQPMESRDGRYAIVYNGELYNFEEIKKELSAKYQFKSASDTEVALYAFAEWREKCLEKFNGIFSFAVWDNEKKELFLARDQFGVKPLYYYHKGDKFIFSSEAKAIFEHSVPREINWHAFNNYFRFLYVLGPETMWQGIMKLPPAHFAVVSGEKMEIKKYYELKSGRFAGGYEAASASARETLRRAVRSQLVSDRPVGLFLSGGLDSSIICALMAEAGSPPVKTFSVGFETEIETEKFNADFNIAAQTAKHFGTTHTPLMISAKDVADNFSNCVEAMDEPVSNHIQVATYLLAKEVKKQVAVVLGGDGGDETFGGYDRYYYMNILGKLRKYLPFIKNKSAEKILAEFLKPAVAEKLCAPSDAGMFLSFMSQKEDLIASFVKPEYNSAAAKGAYAQFFGRGFDLAESAMRADAASWLVDESLIRSDKLTMAHGLEQRVPFLDKNSVELAFSFPMDFKLKNAEQGKKILRHAFSGLVPDFVLEQKKRGFFSPAAKWLRGELRPMAYEIVSAGYCDKTAGLFDWNEIKKIIDGHMEHKKYALNTVWSLMTFQVWAKKFL